MQDVIHAIIVFGGGLALLLSLVQLLQPVRDRRALLLFLIFFSITMLQLYLYLQVYSTGGISSLILAEYLLGPGIYLFYQSIFNSEYTFNLRVLVHFIPAGILLASGTILWLFPGLQSEWAAARVFYQREVLETLQSAGMIVIMVYLLVLFFRLQPQLVASQGRPALTLSIAVTLILFFFLIMLLVTISLFSRELLWRKIAMVLTSLLVIYWFIMSQLNPALFFRDEEKSRKKRKSSDNKTRPELEMELKRLMVEEKVFCDEELSLAKLAEMVKITPHQLSAYLNNCFRLNFNQYINNYRIEEALRIMEDEPDRSLLSIAYGVGFNSKSSFYDVFTRKTGLTPGKYRQNLD